MHACRAGVGSAGVLRETLDVALQGALVAAMLAWGAGGGADSVRGWAWGGAALVGGSQGLQALERRRQAVVRCMQARGHGGTPYAAVVAPAVARPHPSVPVVCPPPPPPGPTAIAQNAWRSARPAIASRARNWWPKGRASRPITWTAATVTRCRSAANSVTAGCCANGWRQGLGLFRLASACAMTIRAR
ncbi:MAG TPA: hypothetical protein PLA98_02835 [Alicycliphilus sp.]|nr:hypothetical protein [Alicycliphilus sp.]